MEKDNVKNGTNFLKKIFTSENKWGVITGIIVAVIGCISYFLPKPVQFLSFIFQVVTVVIITAIFDHYQRQIKHCQRQAIETATESALCQIEKKYMGISGNSTNILKIFQLNDGGNFFNVAHNIFFNKLKDSYSANGEKRKYYFPIETYYEVIKGFLSIGYKIKIINGMLLPFWYVPKEKDEALTKYTKFCKENTESYKRVTYYQDYENEDWKDNTVKMIYLDLLYSEKSNDVAMRWLIELVAKINELNEIFGKKIEKNFNLEELDSNIDYITYENINFKDAIKNNISKVEEFLEQKYHNTTISCEMTRIINDLFFKDMNGKNKFVQKSIIQAKFDKDDINFEDVTEVGYYYKEKDDKEYDQFVMFLNGSNTGPSVEIEIITDEEKVTKIQHILSGIIEETKKEKV